KEFEFDLFNGDINEIFRYPIVQRGKKYYEEDKIKFLEKIDNRYFAIVEGTEKYIVIVKYDEKEKKTQVYCSCPCEFYCKHICAVILAIRDNKFKRFYKIMYKNPNKNLLERIMDFEYFLCLGIVEQNFEIINNYGELELVPILDVNNKYNWEILEDSEDQKLMKQVKYFLDNN
ncbi:TPA: SWIM zinc finger family protein, partial [Candidatus Ventrenecus stercoripullorum]|nr:SWIM zinc finger family protein [Candidatus Ventrenecus stercoripullorum]